MKSFVCGQCEKPFEAKREAIYCSDACRASAWRAKYPNGRQNGTERLSRAARKRSGCQVSYKKAETFVRVSLSGASPELAAHVLRALAMALPDRQRAILAAREQREETA